MEPPKPTPPGGFIPWRGEKQAKLIDVWFATILDLDNSRLMLWQMPFIMN